MATVTGREIQRGAAADLWRHTLANIPCVFGRLVYLASLRNSNTGRYEHHGLSLMFGEHEADRTLSDSHLRAFNEWIHAEAEQQRADLDQYLSGLAVNKRSLIETWLRLAPYRNFVPATVRIAERQLYLTDLETLLEGLKSVQVAPVEIQGSEA